MIDSPSSPLDWSRWSREISRTLALPAGEAHVLQAIAGHADRFGTATPSVELIAGQVRRAVSTVHRLISDLTRRGLLRSRQRGPYRSALRELVADAAQWVGSQMSLFDAPVSSHTAARSERSMSPAVPATAGPARPTTTVPGSAERAPVESCPLTSAPEPSHQRETEEPGEGTATTQPREHAPSSSPHLPAVLEALAEVEHLVAVDAYAVNKSLRSFPEADHVQAANAVVVNALGGWRHPAAKTLFDTLCRQQQHMDRCEERQRRSSAAIRGRPAGAVAVKNTGNLSRFGATWGS